MEMKNSYFKILQPICVKVAHNPTVETIDNLIKLIKGFDNQFDVNDQGLQCLQDYVSFPLKIVIFQKSKFSENVYVCALQCLSILFSSTEVRDFNCFSTLYAQLFMTLNSPSKQIQDNSTSEEIKLAVLECAKTLVLRSNNDVRRNIHDKDFCPALGHSVYVILWIAQNEKSRTLKILAMSMLQALFKVEDQADDLIITAGNRLAAFLPGIVIGIGKVILADSKQGTAVTVHALNLWAHCVALTIGDSQLSSLDFKTDMGDMKDSVPNVQRTPMWVKGTVDKLSLLISKIVALVTHDSCKVKIALLSWCEKLLFNCTMSLGGTVMTILECAITLTSDEFEEVSSKSNHIIKKFSELFSKLNNCDLLSMLEENVYALSTKLPRILRVSDDLQKQSSLNLLSGYIELLGEKTNCLLHSLPNQERLISALIQLAQLDTSQVHILDNTRTESGAIQEESLCGRNRLWPRKYYKHFREDKVEKCLSKVCFLLGFYGDLPLLVDLLLEKAVNSSMNRNETILLLNFIVSGLADDSFTKNCDRKKLNEDEFLQLAKYILDEYLSPIMWDIDVVLSTSNVTEDTKLSCRFVQKLDSMQLSGQKSLEKIRSNITQKCLILEGMAIIAKVLGGKFRGLLLAALCPLLEQVGSSSLLVAHTASLALQTVSQCCNYSSPFELIRDNSDYLSHCLSVKLRHFEDNTDAPIVLDVIFSLSQPEILTLLHDLILQILELLDLYQLKKAKLLLLVLKSILFSIHRWNLNPVETEVLKDSPRNLEDLNLADFLNEYLRLKQVSEDLSTANDEINEENNEEEYVNDQEMEEKQPLPLHVDITLKVLERCIHMQSSGDVWARLLSLDLIVIGVEVLKHREDELLPIIHKLWDPLAKRFFNEDIVVTIKAVDVLNSFAETTGDFIRKRTLTDIWPKIINFLEKQQTVSQGKDDMSSYKFTQNFKLQLKLLSTLGNIMNKLNILEHKLEKSCYVCLSYLVTKHPSALALAAKESLKEMNKLNPDLVWFAVNNYVGCEPIPHHPSLVDLNFKPRIQLTSDCQLFLDTLLSSD